MSDLPTPDDATLSRWANCIFTEKCVWKAGEKGNVRCQSCGSGFHAETLKWLLTRTPR